MRHYVRLVQNYRMDDDPDQGMIQYLLKPGDHAIDLGANIGVYTRLLSNIAGPEGKIVSFEPVPGTFEILSHVCSSLGLSNVELKNMAVGSSIGSVSMRIPQENIYQASVVSSGTESAFSVALTTVDATTQSIDPAFIKIDVEGHELEAIRGANQTLQRCKPSLLIEVSGTPDVEGSSAAELFSELSSLGYSAYWYDRQVVKQRQHGDSTVNYFFLQPSHVELLNNSPVEVVST